MTLRTIYSLTITFACALAQAQTSVEFTSMATRWAANNTRAVLPNEHHFENEVLGALYANSAFAHGYRHGYDQGFHTGDLDIHLGRPVTRVTKAKESGHAGNEYQSGFGSKALFEEGYHAGFQSGYADAASGVEFLATERAKAAGAGLSEVLPATRRAHFDEGVAAGFKSAQSPTASPAQMSVEHVEQQCRLNVTGVYSLEYCSGFGRGYLLGSWRLPSDSRRIVTALETTR